MASSAARPTEVSFTAACSIWLNGAFGAGKTTVAHALAAELPDALVLDPEQIGRMLRRVVPAALRTSDFQDIPSWRRLTVATIESRLRDHPGPLIVPMTVVNPVYFDETVGRLRRSGITVHHFALVACPKTIRRRLLGRLSPPWATWWALRRVERCSCALRSPLFAAHIDTEKLSVPDIVATIKRCASV
ncbi:MAG: AAA family ATPase [Acidobacteria bacterium]|nr:AAA family ATPase [Acidobacteriota bacterium]